MVEAKGVKANDILVVGLLAAAAWALSGVSKGVGQLGSGLGTGLSGVGTGAGSLLGSIGQAAQTGISNATGTIPWVESQLGSYGGFIGDQVQGAEQTIGGFFGDVGDQFRDFGQWAGDEYQAGKTYVQDQGSAFVGWLGGFHL